MRFHLPFAARGREEQGRGPVKAHQYEGGKETWTIRRVERSISYCKTTCELRAPYIVSAKASDDLFGANGGSKDVPLAIPRHEHLLLQLINRILAAPKIDLCMKYAIFWVESHPALQFAI